MKKILITLVVLVVAAVPAFAEASAGRQEDFAEKLQKRVEKVSKDVVDAFVFIGGGSGVLISSDGYFITNHHVGGNMRGLVTVTLCTGDRPRAKLVGTDPVGDISLFKIQNREGLPFVPFGDSDKVEIGQYVVAVGNPFGLGNISPDEKRYPSVSFGIVSATHRYQGGYSDAIQTDAAVNPGNSGGPLVTLDGKLVGINGRIATRFFNRVNSGVGYAIPSNQVKRFLPFLKEGGKAKHGQIKGLRLLRTHSNGAGARISSVSEDSTAEKSGFLPGDVIVKLDDYPIWSWQRFNGALGTYPAGVQIVLTVQRRGEQKTVRVRLDVAGRGGPS